MDVMPSEDLDVENVKFTTTKYPCVRGMKLMARLMKTFGKGLTSLAGMDPNTELSFGGDAMAGLFSGLDENQIPSLLTDVLGGTVALKQTSKGEYRQYPLIKVENIDQVFSGLPYSALFQVVGHAMKVNYGSNFSQGDAASAPGQATPTAA